MQAGEGAVGHAIRTRTPVLIVDGAATDARVQHPVLAREHWPAVLDTVTAFLDHGGSVEGTARALFVHPNTVRYRLRRAAEITGLSVTDPRQGYTCRVALTLGRLSTTGSASQAGED